MKCSASVMKEHSEKHRAYVCTVRDALFRIEIFEPKKLILFLSLSLSLPLSYFEGLERERNDGYGEVMAKFPMFPS